jgi:outer membrane protein assembly factor BamB
MDLVHDEQLRGSRGASWGGMRERWLQAAACMLCSALFIGSWTASEAAAQFGQLGQPASTDEDVFMLAPRVLTRVLREGEAAIADGRYAEGVALLGSLVQDNSEDIPPDLRGQDFFIEAGARGLLQTSIKGEVIRLLSLLPEEGRRTLELQFGVTARNDLNAAIEKRDFQAIATVARKYIHTEAGYDALVLIAEQKLVQGFPLAAANIFQNLLDYPSARVRYGVNLVEAAALAWLQADNPLMAVATLKQASEEFRDASLTIAGQQVPLAASTDWEQAIGRWQAELKGLTVSSTTDAWLDAGGSPQRNAQVNAGLPMSNARWVKEIHSSVPERDALLEVEETSRKAGNVILPKFELRMVDDTIITKTTDAGVLGIDFETGNTKWVHFFGSSAAPLRSISWNRNLMGDELVSRELQKRVWGSTAFGRFSCDRERFYYISTDGEQPINAASLFSGVPVGLDTNYLEGVSIPAQGAIVWRIGGATGQDEPRLAGAYFLGPPLAFEGELFAIAELRGEVRLLVLDPSTGVLLWQQQLAQVNNHPILYDELRQSQALSPTIADGVILCPTGAGAVVTVDLLSRSLQWGATYRTTQTNAANQFRGGAFGVPTLAEFQPLARRWEDNAMIADRGRLIVSPPDSEVMFCRDTLTGDSRLASHPRRNARYVAGMHGDHAILVGESSVSAVGLLDKRVAWEFTYPDERTLAGKGLWQRESMLIPLSGQRIVQLDLRNGALMDQVDVDQPVGNLFAYRNQLLSVTSTAVAAFYTRDSLRRDVDERLAQQPDNTWALNQKSQLLVAEGKIDEGLELLRRSFELDRDNADTQYYLVETMLQALEQDFVRYSTFANELNGVVEYGPQRFRYLQQLALGSIRAGQHLNAFQRLIELMEDRMKQIYSGNPARSSLLKLDNRHSVDSDTWIAAALSQAYEAANAADRQLMDRMVTKAMEQVSGTVVPLRRQRLQYLQWLPAAAENSLQLAAELLGGAEQTTAEQILQPLLTFSDEQYRQRALQALMQPAAADLQYLGQGGRMANQLGLPQTADNAPLASLPEIAWNAGVVEPNINKDFSLFPSGRRIEVAGERYGRPDFAVSLSDSLIAVFNTNGEAVGGLSYTAATSDITNTYTRAVCRGGLLLLETSSEVVAFDVYRGINGEESAQLWRYSLVGAASDEPFVATSLSQTTGTLGIVLPRRQIPNMPAAQVGPLTPATQIVQSGTSIHGLDLLTGKKVWTREGYSDEIRMASDGLELAIVSPQEASVHVVDCRDGHLVRSMEYRGDWTHWFSQGGNIVDFRQDADSNNATIRIWNALNGETIREFTVPTLARANECEQRYLAIADPIGNRFIYADAKTGVTGEVPIKVERRNDVANIGLARFQDKLVIFGQAASRGRQISRTFTEESVNGLMQAVDINNGKPLWERPARFSGMTFPKTQPRNSPFMALYQFDDYEGGATMASSLLLDLRDGSICFADRRFVVRGPGFNMRLVPLEQRVDISIGDRNYQLLMTTEERPPQPVAQFGFDTPRPNRRGGTNLFP